MADILDFRTDSRAGRRTARERHATGEIVIFPGVRYERWESEPAEPKSIQKGKGRRKRDVLELND